MVSVIIPVYNEESTIRETLTTLPLGSNLEAIVVDGGSTDRTKEIVGQFPVRIIESAKNRAIQMNQGAKQARGDIFLFLHADCLIEKDSIKTIENCLSNGYIGGCLNQRINSDRFIFRLIENSGNIRARLLKIFYGDQGIFVKKDLFFKMGGFPEVPVMEDVIFTKKMRRLGKTVVLPDKILVSPRRWEKQGMLKTAFIYSALNILFCLGVPPRRIKSLYADVR